MPLMRAPTNPFTGEPESASALEGEVQGLANPVAAPAMAAVHYGPGIAEIIRSMTNKYPAMKRIIDMLENAKPTTFINFGRPEAANHLGQTSYKSRATLAVSPLAWEAIKKRKQDLENALSKYRELPDWVRLNPIMKDEKALEQAIQPYERVLRNHPQFDPHSPASSIEVLVGRARDPESLEGILAHEAGGHASEPFFSLDKLNKVVDEVQRNLEPLEMNANLAGYQPHQYDSEMFARGIADTIFGKRTYPGGTYVPGITKLPGAP